MLSGIGGARKLLSAPALVGVGSAASHGCTIALIRFGQITLGVLPSQPMNWSSSSCRSPSWYNVAGL